ncbi:MULTISPECIES: hypothetical protein [Cupriavidus]|nr:hypothetical protein [Cupriavidus taiwanensis]
MDSRKPDSIVMRFDLTADPAMDNAVSSWYRGTDNFTYKTAYDMTQARGPLGSQGPLGAFGPLSYIGPLRLRGQSTQPTAPDKSYYNNWCPVPDSEDDDKCVYGSHGPLGSSYSAGLGCPLGFGCSIDLDFPADVRAPLNPTGYFKDMYHLQEKNTWWGNYTHNLDSAGVWGIQGPLGPTGALGALGPLGPLGISVQAGMTTTSDGVYKVGSETVRQTQPVRYSHDATVFRTYELFEMYSKSYAQTMGTSCPVCEVNDTSFGVDSSKQGVAVSGDEYLFTANHDQFVSINVVPINAFNDYGLELYLFKDGGENYTLLASSKSNGGINLSFWWPYWKIGDGLMDFIVMRVKPGEMFRIRVIQQQLQEPSFPGYYLFTTGSGLAETTNGLTNMNPDIWGPRLQQDGTKRFNISGAHQQWEAWEGVGEGR